MKKLSLFIATALLQIVFAQAQVAKKTIVEHFTNTKCSVCASRNPGFHTNLNANPVIQSISIHPSSPYSTCYLSQQNTSDNDARTNYYGVFGGTPRLIINGSIIPTSQNYADAAMFTPFVSTSNFAISIKQFSVGADSILSEISIKRIAMGAPTGTASLFAGLVEDTVFGNGGNGETQHYNVLRRALFTPQGQIVNLPINMGDSIIVNKTENFNSIWNSNRMRTVAILQEEVSKLVIQSELSTTMQIGAATIVKSGTANDEISIFPNPASQYFTVVGNQQKVFNYELSNQFGQAILNGKISNQQRINISALSDGIYFVKIFDECGSLASKIVVKH
jgi:hypothetical protein